MTDQPQKFGSYDRDDEAEEIRNAPPFAAGNPDGSTVGDSLEALFTASDDHFTAYEAVAPNGAVLLLEFDIDLEGDELARYQKLARGNRAARRNGNVNDEDRKPWLSAAAMLSEKSTKITNQATGKVYQDTEGNDLTLVSEEWLRLAGAPKDPVQATLNFFGFPQVISLGNAYMRDTGIDAEPERVGPTNG